MGPFLPRDERNVKRAIAIVRRLYRDVSSVVVVSAAYAESNYRSD